MEKPLSPPPPGFGSALRGSEKAGGIRARCPGPGAVGCGGAVRRKSEIVAANRGGFFCLFFVTAGR